LQFADRPPRQNLAGSLHSVFGFLICILSFAGASYAFSPLDWRTTIELDPGAPVCGIFFWLGWRWRQGESDQSSVFLYLERFCLAAGLGLTFQALLSYTELLDPSPALALAVGSLIATAILIVTETWLYPRRDSRVLLIGCDDLGRNIAVALTPPAIGALEQNPSLLPATLPLLGGFDDIARIVKTERPTKIVIDKQNWPALVSPRFLLQCKMAGIQIEEAPDTYQQLFFRVSMKELLPSELAFSSLFRVNRLAMAAQTIYSNVSGLIALVILAPFLFIFGALCALAAGGGPVFERTECAGFQGIPFMRLRLRTRHIRTGESTGIGKLMEELRLVNAPQVINLVRGEMALFGPQPVRADFVPRLKALMPFYTHKLTVKPGIFGWAQVHGSRSGGLNEESLRLEYDIYYLTQCSPSLDFEILVRTLFVRRTAPELA